jgi:hypothetical protein
MRNKPINRKKPKPYRSMMHRSSFVIDWAELLHGWRYKKKN